MTYEQGYIAVTSDKWFDYISAHELKRVNFWCKKKIFKAISPGQPLFFLRKNSKGEKSERKVVGFGILEHFDVCSDQQAWELYKNGNGFGSYSEFYEGVREILDKDNDKKLGCIILKDVAFFSKPVHLSELDIMFSSAIVSGKKIDTKEVQSILEAGGYNQGQQLESTGSSSEKNYETDENHIMELDIEYYEGSVLEVRLNQYERNQEARRKCIEVYGCKCNICDFDFKKVYGKDGEGFIHVHHVVPISSIKSEYQIDYETDLIPVCPNCHAMIHRKKEPYTINEIKQMLKND